MKISRIKKSSIALMMLISSTQAYAMERAQDEPPATNPPTRVNQEQEAFNTEAAVAVKAKNVQQVSNILRTYESKKWFSPSTDLRRWLLLADHEECVPIPLLTRNGLRPIDEYIEEMFTKTKSEEVKLSILKSHAKQPLLSQPTLEGALRKAAFGGQAAVVQSILTQDRFTLTDECLHVVMNRAASLGHFAVVKNLIEHAQACGRLTEHHLYEMLQCAIYSKNSKRYVRFIDKMGGGQDLINYLRNLTDKGPYRSSANLFFRTASSH